MKINQPIQLPYASMRQGLPPSLDSDEESSQRGGQDNQNTSQKAVYLADLNLCYYQHCQRQTVCQEEDINPEESQLLKVKQSLSQIREGYYKLSIKIKIDNQVVKLNHFFGKSIEAFSNQSPNIECKTPTPQNQSKKGQRSRPSCVQKAIQSVNFISCLSPTISPTTTERKDQKGNYESLSRKASTRINSINIEDLSGEIQSVNQSELKISTLHSSLEKAKIQNFQEDFEEELENLNSISSNQIPSNQQKKSIDIFSLAAICSDEQVEKIKQQQNESSKIEPNLFNTQIYPLDHQLQLAQLSSSKMNYQDFNLSQTRENLEFSSPKFLTGNQSTLSFDISLLQEHSQDGFSPKRNKSNNLIKNILVGFKTSLTNPRSKIYEQMDHEVKIIKGDKYSDFKKKLKQFFKKARTNLSDIISIFESHQKRDIFKIFIEKYSKLWLENSPIQDKDNILQFLDFLLLCYQDPSKIKLLSPYRRNKQRNLYRVTESDKDEEDEKQTSIQYKDQKRAIQGEDDEEEECNMSDEVSPSDESDIKPEQNQENRKNFTNLQKIEKQIKAQSNIEAEKKLEALIEEETFEEILSQDQKRKQRKSSSEKLDNSYEDLSEIQQSHQKSILSSLQRNKLTCYEVIKH